jgi:hypothetical protein
MTRLTIDGLNDDTLCYIFKWLSASDPAALACDVPQVCKRWAAVCIHHSCNAVVYVQLRTQETRYLRQCTRLNKLVEPLPGLLPALLSVRAIANRHHADSRTVIAHIIGGCANTELDLIIREIGSSVLTGINIMALPSANEMERSIEADLATINTLAAHCVQLAHVGLSGMLGSVRRVSRPPDADNALFQTICGSFPLLETLAVQGWQLSTPVLACLEQCPRLSRLEMRKLSEAAGPDGMLPPDTDTAVAALVDKLPRLSIDATRVDGKGDKCYAAEGKKCGSSKQLVTITNSDRATEAGIESLVAACTNIEHMRVWSGLHMQAGALNKLTLAAGTLTHLELHGDGYQHIPSWVMVNLLNSCVKIVRLVIVDSSIATKSVLEAVVVTLAPRLLELTLKVLHEVADSANYDALFEKCKLLERLELVAIAGIQPSTIEALPKTCPRLKTLILRQCSATSYLRLDALAPLKHLRTLEVDYLVTVFLVGWNLPSNITTLRLETTVSDYLVKSILGYLPNLEELSLAITVHGRLTADAFASSAGCLRRLVLQNADGMSASELHRIAGIIPALSLLDLTNIHEVTAAELYQLALAFPALKIINERYHELYSVLAPRARRDQTPTPDHSWTANYWWQSSCW